MKGQFDIWKLHTPKVLYLSGSKLETNTTTTDNISNTELTDYLYT